MTGWTKKPRKRFKHPLFSTQKFCRGYAWDWLCDHAAFKDMPFDVHGKIVQLKRGQLCYSIRDLAEAWNWDKAAVSRYLTRLKTETMIETSTETGKTIITICNYEVFNGAEEVTETPSETPTETRVRQERDSTETQKKNDKKYKKDNYPPNPPEGETAGDQNPKKSKSRSRGTRMDPNWRLPKAWGDWAVSEGVDELNVRRQADIFRDHWLSRSGQAGSKVDWEATWRNWVRRYLDDRAATGQKPQRSSTPALDEFKRKQAEGQI